MSSVQDLTTRARIRNVAIERFVRDGFGASVRSIAAEAGVSAGLVIHHFGSKDALRQECDDVMLAQIREAKRRNVKVAASGGGFAEMLSDAEGSTAMIGYVLRSLQEGGPVGKAFIDHMVEDAVDYTRDAVEQGLVHPSLDEPARARYLVYSALGALLLEATLNPPDDPADPGALMGRFLKTSYQPMLELYSQGLFTTRRILEDYLLYVSDPPQP